ncbi:glutathione S-transferase [Gymnopilus junonius]|uniref:Glutathione S-transferase n=1 Tax=Gymnopilus junonius TaxID=109634 RepID=A0A9P5P0F6_GYMJU|nr:glutathione S-transferase [Gymnopilus junonius]
MGIPDEQIYPYATAAAAKTVAKHQEPQNLVFYSGWFCPFAQRAWISLEERGIPYQYNEINPYKKEPHFLAINPKGLVPAVEYKGKALYESLILCEFFEDAFPNYKPNLLPLDPVDRALARIWLDHITKTFIPSIHRLLQVQEASKQAEALQDLYQSIRKLTDNIKGPYFFGEKFSLVDIAVAPWIVRDWVVEEHRGYKRIDASPKWKEYAELVEKRDSVVNTSSLREHQIEIYGRYLRDEAQSEAAKAIRAGRVIP